MLPSWVKQAALNAYKAGGNAPRETVAPKKPRGFVAYIDEIDVAQILFKSPVIDLEEGTQFISREAHSAVRHQIWGDDEAVQCFDRIGKRCPICSLA